MKHIQTYILLAGLLLGSHASAQTTLYKTYVGRTGIKASCIENYPIGNGLKVTVTMLEANDSVSFHHLTKSLKALPYSGTKSERTNDSVDYYPLKKSINKPLRDYVHELDSTPEFSHVTTLEGSIATAFLGQMKNMDVGDKGVYLIYFSDDTMTALVFHCPNDEVYAQSVKYVLKTTVKKAAAD